MGAKRPGISIAAKLRGQSVREVAGLAGVSEGRVAEFGAGRIDLTTNEKVALQKALEPLAPALLFGSDDEIRELLQSRSVEPADGGVSQPAAGAARTGAERLR